MNLTGVLQSVDLTTVSRVKASVNATRSTGLGDHLHAQVIADVSSRITNYLGFHTLSAARTETYELQQASRMLTLDGRPVDLSATFEIRVGFTPVDADLDALTEEAASTYRVSSPGGWVRLEQGTAHSAPTWARVTYTAGLGATAAAVLSAHGDIARAATLQAKYEAQRADSLGGNVETLGGGASSSFQGEYGLLREVRESLDVHRRHYC